MPLPVTSFVFRECRDAAVNGTTHERCPAFVETFQIANARELRCRCNCHRSVRITPARARIVAELNDVG